MTERQIVLLDQLARQRKRSQRTSRSYEVLIVTADATRSGRASIEPSGYEWTDRKDAMRFAHRFNAIELNEPRGMWAVVKPVT